MTLEEARQAIGQRVEYEAGRKWRRALNNGRGEIEYGRIYKTNKRYVFVEFEGHSEASSTKACQADDLEFAPLPA